MNKSTPSLKLTEQRFFIASAISIMVLCFIGFAHSYYFRAWLSTRVLAPILQLHGLIMTAWIVLFTIQIVFVFQRRVQLHRKLGILGAGLAGVIVGLGILIIVRDIERQWAEEPASSFWTLFAAFDGLNLLLFGGFVIVALYLRRHSATHKRLMLAATLSLLPPAIGRIASRFVQDAHEPITKLALMGACVLLVAIIDTLRNRRLHPAFGWGVLLLIALNYVTYLAQVWT